MPKKTKKFPSFFKPSSLVERRPLSTIVANLSGPEQGDVDKTLKKLTGAEPPKHKVDKTPGGNHIQADEQGICGVTASGSKLIYSPSKRLSMTITSPDGSTKETIELALLVREKDYTPKKKH